MHEILWILVENMEIPLVSVIITTYNQIGYISETVHSVVQQECDFPFEIVLSDDASTDGTTQICERLASQYLNIQFNCNSTNLGLMRNFAMAFSLCRGKYIAIVEGDDYWIDKKKLHKQIALMEAHPNASIVHSNLYLYKVATGERTVNYTSPILPIAGAEDLMFGNYTNTPTVLLRNVFHSKLPDDYVDFLCMDWALFLLHAKHGKIIYHDDITAVYRVHNSLWNDPKRWKYRYNTINQVLQYFIGSFDKEVQEKIKVRLVNVNFKRLLSSIKRMDITYGSDALFAIFRYGYTFIVKPGKLRRYWNYNPWRIR